MLVLSGGDTQDDFHRSPLYGQSVTRQLTQGVHIFRRIIRSPFLLFVLVVRA